MINSISNHKANPFFLFTQKKIFLSQSHSKTETLISLLHRTPDAFLVVDAAHLPDNNCGFAATNTSFQKLRLDYITTCFEPICYTPSFSFLPTFSSSRTTPPSSSSLSHVVTMFHTTRLLWLFWLSLRRLWARIIMLGRLPELAVGKSRSLLEYTMCFLFLYLSLVFLSSSFHCSFFELSHFREAHAYIRSFLW